MAESIETENKMWAAFNTEHNTEVEWLKAQGVDVAFGISIGQIPMGTLVEVCGTEDAQPILDRLAAPQRQNTLALRNLGLFTDRKL